ncbi:MAG TPA: GNAT family N-acetyltransferase [Gaiellales bacterium]|nr:GNAT family N-acetyltransferase [Gaiellales bacterium]
MAAVTVRDGRPEEVHHLAVVAQAAVPGDVVAAGGSLDTGRLEGELGSDRLFVAECEGRVAGYAAVGEDGEGLVLDQLVVAASDQGRGVGNALLDWVEGYGVSRGLRRVRVPAAGADARAREFYQRRGYVLAGSVIERELVHG